jgi:hypothetical protein
MTHRHALQGFSGTSQVSLDKNNKNQLTCIITVPAGSQEVTVAFNFISERTVGTVF